MQCSVFAALAKISFATLCETRSCLGLGPTLNTNVQHGLITHNQAVVFNVPCLSVLSHRQRSRLAGWRVKENVDTLAYGD